VLLFIISFNTSIPNGNLDINDLIFYAAPETSGELNGFFRIRPVAPAKVVKCENPDDTLPDALQEETL